mmetsp:Transcript_42945/g.108678  ORF Transcript_42945/g.108678 Transcript_42945/m.108678 type:complete len:103 (+) Transcript_42945:224-532(+)
MIVASTGGGELRVDRNPGSRPTPGTTRRCPLATRRVTFAVGVSSERGAMAGPPAGVVVVMGVSGSGKSTVGTLLAEALQCPFHDADDFHPPENIEPRFWEHH